MDGSTLLTTNLDWVNSLHDQIGAGVVGFYIDGYTRDARSDHRELVPTHGCARSFHSGVGGRT